jgi:DNA-binding transcriptional ArsR family regulator
MVVDTVAAPTRTMPDSGSSEVDDAFHALADLTRRDILRQAGVGEYSVSQLASRYPMSFAAVQKHVAVLERAGLVSKERRGREQIVHVDTTGVRRVRQALDDLEAIWRGRVDRMAEVLAEPVLERGKQR